jgi:SAM-dependent methyltransferase
MSIRRKVLLAGSAFGLGAGTAAAAAIRTRQPPPPPPPPPPLPPAPPAHQPWVEAVTRRPRPFAQDPPGPASSTLYARIAPEDLAILEEKIAASPEPPIRELWERAEPHQKPRLAVLFSTYFQIPGALEATGLLPDMPPDEVHAMARGPIAAGGDLYIADIVLTYLEEAGMAPAAGERILDFGSSSGRVLRVIGALRPDLELLGCDPNEGAIAWAAEHLPMGRFFVSPTEPPLELEDASLDGAYAISIWSHFDAGPALAWLDEMHRVVKPGGWLLITTHGLDAVAWLTRGGHMTPESAGDVTEQLVASSHRFLDVFGEEGDWGVKAAGWGNTFLTLDWLVPRVTPQWSVRLVKQAALAEVQDIIVLERRP